MIASVILILFIACCCYVRVIIILNIGSYRLPSFINAVTTVIISCMHELEKCVSGALQK